MTALATPKTFFGWRVVAAAFVLAVFGWGFGFYGPPVFLHAVRAARGWSLALVSAAVTVHYLFGAVVVANLPKIYRRLGVPMVTKLGAISLAGGITGWALALEPWQLFVATLFSGAGWASLGGAAVNTIVSPWFVRRRPAALSSAYNGASIGGVLFSPLWVAAINQWGFPLAAAGIGIVMTVTLSILSDLYFGATPEQMGTTPDDDAPAPPSASPSIAAAPTLPGGSLWRDGRFVTLAFGMSLALFAQIGLLAHLFSLLVPALGAQLAGIAAGAATVAAIAGRTLVGWLMSPAADRRLVVCATTAIQILGSTAFLFAAGTYVPLLLLGVVLFGLGIGTSTSLPPLIAQVEFAKPDVARVVSLVIAVTQASYAFAPAAFGMIRQFASGADAGSADTAPNLFIAAAALQALGIIVLLAGRRRPTSLPAQ